MSCAEGFCNFFATLGPVLGPGLDGLFGTLNSGGLASKIGGGLWPELGMEPGGLTDALYAVVERFDAAMRVFGNASLQRVPYNGRPDCAGLKVTAILGRLAQFQSSIAQYNGATEHTGAQPITLMLCILYAACVIAPLVVIVRQCRPAARLSDCLPRLWPTHHFDGTSQKAQDTRPYSRQWLWTRRIVEARSLCDGRRQFDTNQV